MSEKLLNREIKFRVWDIENKEMLDLEELDYEFGEPAIRTTMYSGYFGADEMILMQYTGLKDKNGVEIYEGDIVKKRNKIGYIKYGEFNCGCCHGVYGWTVEPHDYRTDINDYEELEVIGNIYDNPELIEKEGK